MGVEDLRPGLRHSAAMVVTEAMAVSAASGRFPGATDMPPVLATANLIAFVEWTCVEALAPYVAPHQRTVGTHIDMSHSAATPIGMSIAADIELVAIEGRRLRFRFACHDAVDAIGEGFHERAVVDHARFMRRLDEKIGPG
ncbi:MAG: thioesterase family protein [Alphaproteobacteria bacterium]|nr:thioesterase family protein [Alphaproteobacteria bacterium]